MASRKRARETLPSSDDLLTESEGGIHRCETHASRYQAAERQETVRDERSSEDDKVCWRLAAYLIITISRLCVLLNNRGAGLAGMTEYQGSSIYSISQCIGSFARSTVGGWWPSILQMS